MNEIEPFCFYSRSNLSYFALELRPEWSVLSATKKTRYPENPVKNFRVRSIMRVVIATS
jgi:hypothetical protein